MLLTNSQIKNTLALKNELNSEKIHYENLFIFLFSFAAAVLIFPSGALARACCADAGTYSINVRKPSKSEFDELKNSTSEQRIYLQRRAIQTT